MTPERYRAAVKRFILPKRFCGVAPLYLGVELVLGITIFNKCGGAYGILALFNGHPLEFAQWVLYTWSIVCLAIYAQGLAKVHRPTLYTFSQVFIFFSVDTLLTCAFTVYFTHEWFAANTTTRPPAAQGASDAYEYSVSLLVTLASLVSRLYFNFIVGSFLQELFFRPAYTLDTDEVETELRHSSLLRRLWLQNQHYCYILSRRILS
ncbi:hypothetical protein TBLA_0A06520 [Henningerozyma blattae CBS 6284]|uniref:Uncharacterized protein n=1 Tax=Henningerozyma blattae (strain ATCC 34711 / CBS 6284 / DSM 70876 / NBRC 10599 / NRRL Y-10934 / UCD 77-7) TaxID=1071380 RepID=I2GWE2_HENB6|nr:hypothetical protein TBLA_0A06520 [Tetrapisispora blattae CBS 6284]CCH58444.1 hypothetical protein TBLA_0A06520 [Tetrapisispora blattae CBS 6284]